MQPEDIAKGAVIILAAFLPPFLYLVWIRNTEKHRKEPWSAMLKTFFWGALIAVFIAVFLSLVLVYIYSRGIERITYLSFGENPTLDLLILVVVIAPFTEEFAKGIGVYTARNQIVEEEDGLIYGASCGLGFSATENLLYGFAAYATAGWGLFFGTIIVRSLASTLLHASSTSVMGFGISKSLTLWERTSVIPYYLGAVGMHASFNLLASMGTIYEGRYGPEDPYTALVQLFGLMVVMIFALVSIGLIRRKIASFDRKGGGPLTRRT